MTDPFEDFHTIVIDGGDVVLCDFCNSDFTHSEATGGFLFQSKAVCPDCEVKMLGNIKKYDEEKYIRATCPEGMTFYNWIMSLR